MCQYSSCSTGKTSQHVKEYQTKITENKCGHIFQQDMQNQTIYVILARHKGLPEDDILTSKHVGTNHM